MDLTELGTRIKMCRKKEQLTQEKLAELIDVSPHYIYEIEKGLKCMSLHTLVDISSALHISTDYLLFGRTAGFPPEQGRQPEFPERLYSLLGSSSPEKTENILEVLTLLLPYIK